MCSFSKINLQHLRHLQCDANLINIKLISHNPQIQILDITSDALTWFDNIPFPSQLEHLRLIWNDKLCSVIPQLTGLKCIEFVLNGQINIEYLQYMNINIPYLAFLMYISDNNLTVMKCNGKITKEMISAVKLVNSSATGKYIPIRNMICPFHN